MSEERFDRIDQQMGGLDQRMGGLDQRMDGLGQRMDRLENGQQALRADVSELRGDVAQLQDGQHALTSTIAEFHRHMLVLHEQVVGDIKALSEGRGPSIAELVRELALREPTERRLDVLEAVARHHSSEIDQLKRDQKS